MASRLNLPRLGAAVLGASTALLLSVALPANADPAPPSNTPVVGHMDGAADQVGTPVVMDYTDNGRNVERQVPTVLFGLLLKDGTLLHTYCDELTVMLNRAIPMHKTGWGDFPNPDSPFSKNNKQINWILHNSYPQLSSFAALGKAAGLPDTISKADAIAATQAAIWHFSDNGALAKADSDITGLYHYLTGAANIGMAEPDGSQNLPANPKLSITPDKAVAGQAGSKIGPFTVNTNIVGTDGLELTSSLPAGVTLTDTKGAVLDPKKIVNGTQFYVNVPAGTPAGSGSFTLSTPATIGMLFVGTDNGLDNGQPQKFGAHPNCGQQLKTQTQIVAATSVTDSAAFSWSGQAQATGGSTPSPTPGGTPTSSPTTSPAAAAAGSHTGGGSNLAFTGVSLIAPIGLAIVLIGGGGTFLLLQRRRRA